MLSCGSLIPEELKMLSTKLREKLGKTKPKRKESVWKGPCEDGITQSLLSRWLVCRERFRLLVVEGLKPADGFNKAIEYGNMWHVCEEGLAAGRDWSKDLLDYCIKLRTKYKLDQNEVEKWFQVCKVQFPVYVSFWKKRGSRKKRMSISQEEVFKVPYKLPSGRVVYLRGKFDGVNKVTGGVELWENKTKGEIDEEKIAKQLIFDLQTMIYIIALRARYDNVKGVLYNVIRRPLSGGKGSIRQHKPTKSNPSGESSAEYYNRLSGIIEEDPTSYFMRWEVVITDADVEKFEATFLKPCLEQLCDWWGEIDTGNDSPWGFLFNEHKLHYRFPYGVYNPLIERGASDLDEYLNTGSEVGLQRTDSLFGELQ